MAEHEMKEWFLEVPWGKMAMLSRGASSLPPVLLVHGFMDTAATFIPLMAAMPPTYYYVTYDLPGHGFSDTIPGPCMSILHLVETIRQIVEQLKWNSFYCIGHSMGYLISSYYNAAFPGRLRKLVSVAGIKLIEVQGLAELPKEWFEHTIDNYYRRYFPPPPSESYSYDEALTVMSQVRGVSEASLAVLAKRCLQPVGDGKFKFTWDPKVKKIHPPAMSSEILYFVLSIPTPTLNLVPTEDSTPAFFKEYAAAMLSRLKSPLYAVVDVPGGHSVHLDDPGLLVPHIVRFFSEGGAKL